MAFRETQHCAKLESVLEALLDRPAHAREIARAVEACLCNEEGGATLASDRTLLLSARALSSIGDRAGSEIVLQATTGYAPWAGRVDPARWPAQTARLVESGLLSATVSPILGSGIVARLDLRLLPPQQPALELIYLPLIHRLVDSAIPLWRDARGVGALLVQGLSGHGSFRSLAWMRETFRARLERASGSEGWTHPPHLVFSD